MEPRTVALVGTLDTKAPEFEYLRAELSACGLGTLIVDISCGAVPGAGGADVTCVEVARRAGAGFDTVMGLDRQQAGNIMVAGATQALVELHAERRIHGIIALGGANGTLMACAVMRAFPIGLPKVMVSVVAASDPRSNVGTKDIVLINAVTDLSLNDITRRIMRNAAAAMAGMLTREALPEAPVRKTQVGATMLGLTQECVLGAKASLEAKGAEFLVFHTNGIGGAGLESLVAAREIDAVLDLTINEVGNHLLGGVFDAGPRRMEAAAAAGIPQLVVPGAIDFVNFWGTYVPTRYRARKFIFHNVQNTLMRTTAEENLEIGRIVGVKLNRSTGKVMVLVPERGFSGNDRPGGANGVTIDGAPAEPWHEPESDRAFVQGLKSVAKQAVEIYTLDAHINDPAFHRAVTEAYYTLARDQGQHEGERRQDANHRR